MRHNPIVALLRAGIHLIAHIGLLVCYRHEMEKATCYGLAVLAEAHHIAEIIREVWFRRLPRR